MSFDVNEDIKIDESYEKGYKQGYKDAQNDAKMIRLLYQRPLLKRYSLRESYLGMLIPREFWEYATKNTKLRLALEFGEKLESGHTYILHFVEDETKEKEGKRPGDDLWKYEARLEVEEYERPK